MAYPEDLLNKYIQLNRTGTALSEQEKKSLDYVLTGHSANLTIPVFRYQSGNPGTPVVPGKPPVPQRQAQIVNAGGWNVCFLDYFPGKVTAVQLSQYPVLTGPMSGCYLFRYEDSGSTWCSHVGTSTVTEESIQGKRNWKRYAGSRMATDIWGQSPLNFFEEAVMKSATQLAGALPQIFGLFEPGEDREFYALLLGRIARSTDPMHGYIKCFAVRKSYLERWDVISKTSTFQSITT